MFTATITAVDFLDAFPVVDAMVELTATLVGGWEPKFDARGDDQGSSSHGDPAPSGQIVYDTVRAQVVRAQGATDAAGHAVLTADFTAAMAKISALTGGPQTSGGAPETIQLGLVISLVDLRGLKLSSAHEFHSTTEDFEGITITLSIDPARSIVGDTSATSSLLWFQLHAQQGPNDCVCVVTTPTGDRRFPVAFLGSDVQTGTIEVDGLTPATVYPYELRQVTPTGVEYPLTRGSFRTFQADPTALTIAFGSCHLPTDDVSSLSRWHSLAARTDIDLVALIGDQIYGDGVADMTGTDSLTEKYDSLYTLLWTYPPVRNVLRRHPTYMVLDDHEVTDDWGIHGAPITEDRIAAAMDAYKRFQQAHNPGGTTAPTVDFHFRRGPAAFYFTDSRTARGKESDFPILGSAQMNRLTAWAQSDELKTADLVFLIVPVPPAVLPFAELEKAAKAAGALAGAYVGAILGGFLGVGAIAGAVVGAAAGELIVDYKEHTILEPDVRDAWTHEDNQPDLVHLLDLAFDIGNDIGSDGLPGPHPRAVIMLTGDYHYGAIHTIRSNRDSGAHDHRRNPSLLQVMSSPISKNPTSSTGLKDVLAATAHGTFPLDTDGNYTGVYESSIIERNYGRVAFDKLGTGRRYRIQAFVDADTTTLARRFDIDLDASPVQITDLADQVMAVSGRITLLRVHEVGSGYGPPGDLLDAEVIVTLDSAPGMAFGFQLRNDGSGPQRQGTLRLLRGAFQADRIVEVEYHSTGPMNGQVIRVTSS